MKLYLRGHDCRYAMEQLQLSLFPGEPSSVAEPGELPAPGEDLAVSQLSAGRQWLTAVTTITLRGQTHRVARRIPLTDDERLRRRLLQGCYYDCALHFLPQAPAWGALSGVRPTKLVTAALLEGRSRDETRRELRQVYRVSPQRAELALDCGEASVRALARTTPEELSVYVGIPFCPTRCVYCSFISRSCEHERHTLGQYLQALLDEIDYTGQLLRRSGRRISTVYFGGGTPTTLDAGQMEQLMAALERAFDLSHRLEYTIEGGRPDTLSAEKLRLMRCMGADRMSINPQSMNDHVLALAGRQHTAAMVEQAVAQAREAGFAELNMDLIAGLPGDSFDSFARSLERVLALRPENITVHTLALKKAAALYERREGLPPVETVAQMVGWAWQTLRRQGYVPYYLYRQKYMSGSFENIGWCIPGHECLYNIYMMEEQQSILALGGGGITKLVKDGRIERWNGPKDPLQYLSRPEELRRKKDEFFAALGR